MGGANEPEQVDVDVTEESGKYTLTLKNFTLGGETPVGTIVVKDLEGTKIGNETLGYTTIIKANQNITIAAGDDDTVKKDEWLGPALGLVPIIMHGEISGDNFNCVLNISLPMMEMQVGVNLGNKATEIGQLPNSGFENFHTASYKKLGKTYTSDEPNCWHSFMTASGSFASNVATATHTYIDSNVRTKAEDANTVSTKCVKIISTPVKLGNKIIASANGTITTGRLQAGSMTASSNQNCSFLDFTNTNKDGNNDPYYTVLNNKPDAMKVWVKYQAGEGNTENAKATISAILSNGGKIQDPKDDQYNANIIAEAKNSEITNTEWQQITIPFTYSDTKAIPQGALVTMSTCATASGGSQSETKPDILWVDDVEMVYNYDITSIKYGDKEIKDMESLDLDAAPNLDDFKVTSDGVGAYISKMITYDEDHDHTSGTIFITVTSNDLKNATTKGFSFTISDKSKLSETFTTMDYGWATYTPYIPVKFPTADGIKAYTAKIGVNGGVETTEINGTVAPGTPLLLRAQTQGAQEYTLTGSNEEAVKIEGNGLNPAEGDGSEWNDDYTLYVLSSGKKGVGFYKLAQGTIIPKDKCYLILVNPNASAASFLSLDGSNSGTTAIDHIENAADANTNAAQPLYNLAGQKVNAQYKGIVIKGGKKMVIK